MVTLASCTCGETPVARLAHKRRPSGNLFHNAQPVKALRDIYAVFMPPFDCLAISENDVSKWLPIGGLEGIRRIDLIMPARLGRPCKNYCSIFKAYIAQLGSCLHMNLKCSGMCQDRY